MWSQNGDGQCGISFRLTPRRRRSGPSSRSIRRTTRRHSSYPSKKSPYLLMSSYLNKWNDVRSCGNRVSNRSWRADYGKRRLRLSHARGGRSSR